MAPNLAITVCLIAKRSLQGQHQNFKSLGIAKFGKDRLTTGTKRCIGVGSLLFILCVWTFVGFLDLEGHLKNGSFGLDLAFL